MLFLFPPLVSGEEKNPFGSLQNHSLKLIWEGALQGENLFRKGEYSGVLQKARELSLYASESSSALALTKGYGDLLEAQVASRRGFDEEALRKASEARKIFAGNPAFLREELLCLEVLLRSAHALGLEEDRRNFEAELEENEIFQKDPYGKGLSLLHKGIRAFESRNCPEARNFWRESAEVARGLDNPEIRGLALKHAARCAWLIENEETALKEYAGALEFARQTSSPWLECMISLEYAEVLVRGGEYIRGEELLLQALEEAEELALGAPLLWICNNLGALYLEVGSFSRAEKILEKAQELQRRPGIPRDLGLLVNLGSAAMGVGDYPRSEGFWLEARKLASEREDVESLPGIALNLGILAKKRGNYAEAGGLFSEALAGFDALGRERDTAGVMLQLAGLMIVLKEPRQAREALEEAKRVYASLKDGAGMAWVGLEEGKLELLEGNLLRGRRIFEELLKKPEVLSSPELELGALEGLGRCYLEEGYPERARKILERAMALLEEERRNYVFLDRRVAFMDYAASLYELLFETCLHGEDLPGALETLERMKARSYLDLMNGREVALHAEEEHLAEALQALETRRGFLEKRKKHLLSQGFSGESPEIRGIYKALEEVLQKRKLLREELPEVSPRLQAMAQEDFLSSEEIRDRLPGGRTFLHFYFSSRRGGALLVRKDMLRWISLEGTAESIAVRIAALVPKLGDADQPLPKRELRELYTLLMEPLEKFLSENERVVILPHGVLGYLPFEVLLRGEEFLVDRYVFSYAPSLGTLLSFPEIPEETFPKSALFVGDPLYPDSRLPSLQSAKEEALLIGQFFSDSLVLTGDKATESAVKEQAPFWNLLHWATHARTDASAPLKSEILFTRDEKNDGFLQASEIFDIHFSATCVVLSACETGLGKLSSQEGLIGFVRSFMARGVPSIVVSLWSVYDRSTRDFFLAFYSYWKGGISKAEALRKAKIRLRSSYAHPAFWAPFVLYGW